MTKKSQRILNTFPEIQRFLIYFKICLKFMWQRIFSTYFPFKYQIFQEIKGFRTAKFAEYGWKCVLRSKINAKAKIFTGSVWYNYAFDRGIGRYALIFAFPNPFFSFKNLLACECGLIFFLMKISSYKKSVQQYNFIRTSRLKIGKN